MGIMDFAEVAKEGSMEKGAFELGLQEWTST